MIELKNYTNPITTKENINELHHLLVQTCLDYMKKNNLTDIDEIHFSADGLSGSSYEAGEWTPATDSSIEVIGLEEEEVLRVATATKPEKVIRIPVRARIGFQM